MIRTSECIMKWTGKVVNDVQCIYQYTPCRDIVQLQVNQDQFGGLSILKNTQNKHKYNVTSDECLHCVN